MKFVIFSSEIVYYTDEIYFDESQVRELAEFVAHEEGREVDNVMEELGTEAGRRRIAFDYWYDCFYDLMKFDVREADRFEIDEIVSPDEE